MNSNNNYKTREKPILLGYSRKDWLGTLILLFLTLLVLLILLNGSVFVTINLNI